MFNETIFMYHILTYTTFIQCGLILIIRKHMLWVDKCNKIGNLTSFGWVTLVGAFGALVSLVSYLAAADLGGLFTATLVYLLITLPLFVWACLTPLKSIVIYAAKAIGVRL